MAVVLNMLCCRLFKVSAASISSTDRPDKTLAALVERSCSESVESRSITLALGRSAEERCDAGGEKGGGAAYGGLIGCWASMVIIKDFTCQRRDKSELGVGMMTE